MPIRLPLRLLSLVLLSAILAPPAAAQGKGKEPAQPMELSGRFAHPPRVLYRAAFAALRERGYPVQVRLLDQYLQTAPHAGPVLDLGRGTTQVAVALEPDGDSTRMSVAAVAGEVELDLPGDPDPRTAAALAVATDVMHAIMTAVEEGAPPPLAERTGYAYDPEDPVRVGGPAGPAKGAERQRAWLASLRGPDGAPVEWERLGSCCQFPTGNSPSGSGALDAYEVRGGGLERPVLLYLDMYTPPSGAPRAPEGFTRASGEAPGAITD